MVFSKVSMIGLAALFLTGAFLFNTVTGGQEQKKPLDPKAWGGNHVGGQIPQYVQGDECLFCHRSDIGPTWQDNAHTRTIRDRKLQAGWDDILKSQQSLTRLEPEIEFLIGTRKHIGFLKKSGYGKFDLLSAHAVMGSEGRVESWRGIEKPQWEKDKFDKRCAGCHATAVDQASRTFNAYGLDCYSCHGDVDLGHTKDTTLVLLSKKRRKEAQVITSLCAQCHLRGGKSTSTGLPYPNTFISGDNLFQDFEVDFSKAVDPDLNPGDRHIYRNVRDVAINGDESITCVNCHQVHTAANASIRHRRILRAPICAECHNPEGSFKFVKPYTVRSETCEY